jgi:hypothetical protein
VVIINIFIIGEFSSNKINGYGYYTNSDNAMYEGTWQKDIQLGLGIETWPDGTYYQGVYDRGMKNGIGK